MSQIHIEIEGTFGTFEEAARAIEDAARTVREGRFIGQQPGNANPSIFIQEYPDDDECTFPEEKK